MARVFLPFALPLIGEEEISEVIDTLRSGWITTGPRIQQFEEEFARYIGCKHAVAVNSCTAALHLGLHAIGLKRGDKVLTTPYTFAATAEVIHYFGAHPVFVDIQPETLNIDPEKIRERLEARRPRERIKAVIPVHIGGWPCKMDSILEIAGEYGLKVIEDAAHALPTKYRGRIVGTIGDITAFSFYANKNITTGEGGMATTDNDEYAETMRMMRLHGISKDAWKRYTAKGHWYYEIHQPGFKYNLPDLAAAIGIHQLRKCDQFHRRREQIASMYHQGLSDFEEIRLPAWDLVPGHAEDDGSGHAWHLFVIRLNLKKLTITRGEFIDILKERKIGTSVHFIPLHMQPFYRETYGYRAEDFPNSRRAFEEVVSLPIYPKMMDEDVDYVITTIKKTVRAHRRRFPAGSYAQKQAEIFP
jgi:perosamine synthetase